jgi:hypothetical protein
MKHMFRSVLSIALAAFLAVAIVTPAVAQRNAPDPLLPPLIGGSNPYDSPLVQAIALVQDGSITGWKGFNNFTHPATGIYCLTLEPDVLVETAPVVSIEWGASFGVNLFAQWDQFNDGCGGTRASYVVTVRTYKGDTGGVGSGYQIPKLSDEVAFVVLVP